MPLEMCINTKFSSVDMCLLHCSTDLWYWFLTYSSQLCFQIVLWFVCYTTHIEKGDPFLLFMKFGCLQFNLLNKLAVFRLFYLGLREIFLTVPNFIKVHLILLSIVFHFTLLLCPTMLQVIELCFMISSTRWFLVEYPVFL